MDNCIICKIIRGEAESWKVFENESVYAFLDIHLHIVPRKTGDGQDVRWTRHPEWVEKFDDLLERIR